jgi:hypothetical protein
VLGARKVLTLLLALIVVVCVGIAVFTTFDTHTEHYGDLDLSCGSPIDENEVFYPGVAIDAELGPSCDQLLAHARATRTAALAWALAASLLLVVISRMPGRQQHQEVRSCLALLENDTYLSRRRRLRVDGDGFAVGLRRMRWTEVSRLVQCGRFLQWHVRVVPHEGRRFMLLGRSVRSVLNSHAPEALWRREPRQISFTWQSRPESEDHVAP